MKSTSGQDLPRTLAIKFLTIAGAGLVPAHKQNTIMKKIINLLFAAAALAFLIPMGSCTDNGGDGIDSIIWNGSQNPENTSFRNPVWEPSLEGGTIVKGASMYVAIAATSQWAPGLTYYCKTLTSNDLMSWNAGNNAFSIPDSLVGKVACVNSLSADYARTVTGANYWMFYTLKDSAFVGAATATTAAGPYNDRGPLIKAADVNSTTISDPFFIVASNAFYLCYTTDAGTYIQRLRLNRASGANLQGKATKIAGPGISDIAIVRESSSRFYLIGTVTNDSKKEIHYAMASSISGPYRDKAGTSLTDGSNGEVLITDGTQMVNPENPMRGFFNSDRTHLFLAYNATEQGNETMKSGYLRKPMLLSPIAIGEDGWLTAVQAQKGWTTPRFN